MSKKQIQDFADFYMKHHNLNRKNITREHGGHILTHLQGQGILTSAALSALPWLAKKFGSVLWKNKGLVGQAGKYIGKKTAQAGLSAAKGAAKLGVDVAKSGAKKVGSLINEYGIQKIIPDKYVNEKEAEKRVKHRESKGIQKYAKKIKNFKGNEFEARSSKGQLLGKDYGYNAPETFSYKDIPNVSYEEPDVFHDVEEVPKGVPKNIHEVYMAQGRKKGGRRGGRCYGQQQPKAMTGLLGSTNKRGGRRHLKSFI